MTITFSLISPDGTEFGLDNINAAWQVYLDGWLHEAGMPAASAETVSHPYRVDTVRRVKFGARTVALPLKLAGDTQSDLMTALKTLEAVLPRREENPQAGKIKATDGSTTVYLDVYYLELVLQPETTLSMAATLRMLAADPRWYDGNNTTQALTSEYNLGGGTNAVLRRRESANAATWQIPYGGITGQVEALAADPNATGAFYAGGLFSSAGYGLSVSNIARFNGSTWEALGGSGAGTNGIVYALAVDHSGNLYVGGSFTTAGGVTANNIAKWDGSTWSALGSGTNGTVRSLFVGPDDTLYVGGDFTTAGGSTMLHLATWDGSSWNALGDPDGSIYAIIMMDDGTLVVGGSLLTSVGGITTQNVAAYKDGSWLALNSSGNFDAAVNALEVMDGHIYAGGAFSGHLKYWDGATWMSVAPGGVVDALSASGNMLYAGGYFGASGTISKRIALWNGSGWVSADIDLYGATSQSVNAIIVLDNDDIVIGISGSVPGARFAYTTQVTVTHQVRPQITVVGPGKLTAMGLDGALLLWSDMEIYSGETVTIDCDAMTVTSNLRGNLLGMLQPGSRMQDFVLDGTHLVTVLSDCAVSLVMPNRYLSLAEALG